MLEKVFLDVGEWPVSKAIGASLWVYPVVQAFHLVFLAILVGAILIVDLRLLGRGMTRQPVSLVARDAWPWFVIGIIGMALTGIPQLMQNANREYYSEFFWQKMYFLAVAFVFTIAVHWKLSRTSEGGVPPLWHKFAAVISMFLWGGVVVSGRLIGLFT